METPAVIVLGPKEGTSIGFFLFFHICPLSLLLFYVYTHLWVDQENIQLEKGYREKHALFTNTVYPSLRTLKSQTLLLFAAQYSYTYICGGICVGHGCMIIFPPI